MRTNPAKRCKAIDWGRRCQREAKAQGLCKRDYMRALRNNGETRTKRELRYTDKR